MELKSNRTIRQVLWLAQGLAIAALWAGPGSASATITLSSSHAGNQYRGYYRGPTAGQNQDANGGQYDHSAGNYDDHPRSGDSGTSGGTFGWNGRGDPATLPEPGTLALFFAGIGGLLVVSVRRGIGRGATRRAARLIVRND